MQGNVTLRSLRDHSYFIVLGVLLGLGAAGLLTWTTERTYTSSTQLFVGAVGATDTADAYEGNLFSQERVASYAQILTSPDLAERVVDELGLDLTAGELAAKVTAAPVPETVVLEVKVTDTSAERAQAIATSLGRQFASRVTELETPAGASSSTVAVSTIQTPDFNPEPASPDVPGTLGRGAAIGLVLGTGVALLRTRTDRAVRRDDDVEEAAGAHVVGRVLEQHRWARTRLPADVFGQSPAAEAYRALRVNLRHLDGRRRPQAVVVTGPLPGAGASTVAVNLSASLAASGQRVLLIDGDLRRPRVTHCLGLPDGPGLTDVLTGSAELHDVVRPWRGGRLSVLGAGPLPSDPEALLGSARMRSLLDVLRDQYDQVILDAPPLLSVVDAAVLSAVADSCLLVARYGRTRREHLAEAAAMVTRVRVPSLGVVLNRVPRRAAVGSPGARGYRAEGHRRTTETMVAGSSADPDARPGAGAPDRLPPHE
ncbi:polysaccharide biosynthesis tyrosine autokinase [Blastococcus mobilis]|uniref:Capsular exopolysaccharide family n=1 Tax=Blastococcus mobilis TaxID=1938746 RepID=A0A238Z126_9ACTN|nr:polysaccharide biosynthesis tyrosine autokinase [Blastococcus mobilis]SNR77067.1 capsular exopolysaccharide family [Blastococcus mobilis]